MKKKALLISFFVHLILLFGIIVAITFIRKDFDFIITAIISVLYITILAFYFIILFLIIGRKEPINGERLKASKKPSFKSALRYWIF
ncbi:MAG: hypothetical protein ACXACY_21710, partial [Candidatus Hodarchaeales archaeon]